MEPRKKSSQAGNAFLFPECIFQIMWDILKGKAILIGHVKHSLRQKVIAVEMYVVVFETLCKIQNCLLVELERLIQLEERDVVAVVGAEDRNPPPVAIVLSRKSFLIF